MPVFKVTARIDGTVTFDVIAPKGAVQALEMAKKLLADGLFTTTTDPIVNNIVVRAWSDDSGDKGELDDSGDKGELDDPDD